MLVYESVQTGLRQIKSNKLRSFLTMLGVILGVASLMCMFSIFAGIQKSFNEFVEEAGGMEKVTIHNTIPKVDGSYRRDLRQGLTYEDAIALKEASSFIRAVSPEIHKDVFMRHGSRFMKETVKGVIRDALVVNKYELESGRFITQKDLDTFRNVCVIGTKIAKDLFPKKKNILGEVIIIHKQSYTVVGVLKHYELRRGRRKKNALEWKNKVVFVPLTAMQKQFKGAETLSFILYTARDRSFVGRSSDEVQRILLRRHKGIEDFSIKTFEEHLQKSQESAQMIAIALSFIAGISLIVGGIGILNIMLATISERIREIGLRKALGARENDILVQFLIESIILSTIGGVVGIVIGFFGSFLFAEATQWTKPVLLPSAAVLAFSFSVGTGVIFGLFPALKAAHLDPIEALRYQ